MIRFYLNKTEYTYETENIIRLFFPCEKIETMETIPETEPSVYAQILTGEEAGCHTDMLMVKCGVSVFGRRMERETVCPENEGELNTARLIYEMLCDICQFTPKWGVLTGVRPSKLLSTLTKEYGSVEEAVKDMNERLLVSPQKTKLCKRCFDAELKAQEKCDEKSFSLYVSIPFCPTRCSYCSFVSHSIEKAGKLVEPYVELLCREIEETAKITKELGLTLCTVYFGGGTPTQLSAKQLERVMTAINHNFDMSNVVEYTIEAGRPDTVTKEKLETIKRLGANRISINPQTMSNQSLERIGRKHTVEQTIDAYNLARNVGIDFINMDLIAGLPEETVEDYIKSLDDVISLNPENITVHVLSMKRSSRLVVSGEADYNADSKTVEEMLKYSEETLTKEGYKPYYLYRQSKMLGNHENVGWSKDGYDCLYNIYMMNELHTVISVGAGGVTRLKQPNGTKIERIFNYKFPYEYIDRFDQIIERKRGVKEFYDKYK